MQALFSRTAQARTSCRCMSCGHAARAVARRTTTAAPKRRVGAGDLFTACYSTILASAAIADAEVKRERRKEWDRVIEEARSEKTALEPGERGLELEMEQRTYSQISARRHSTHDDGSNSVLRRPAHILDQNHGSTTTTPLQGRLKELDLRIKQSLQSMDTVAAAISASTTATTRTTLADEIEDDAETWADEEPLPGTGFREPRSSLHLRCCEDSTSRLVMQLLGKISIFLEQDSYRTTKKLSKKTKAILEDIEGLHSSFTKFPNFSWGTQELVRATRSALHLSIYKICQSRPGKRDVDSIIAKICYNLLVSTTPPSIITYNIMIGELSRLKLHDVTQVIIDSYFCDTRFAPTMETIQLMLDHYIAKGDRAGFNDMLDRLRSSLFTGKSELGKPIGNMRLGMRSVKELYLPDVREWAMEQKVIHRDGFLIRKAPRNSGIFDSIIRGCLQMESVRRATRYLKAAFREGHIVRSECIYSIAIDCVKALDHKSGRLLLDAILTFWKDDAGVAVIDFPRHVRYAIYQLLSLCGVVVADGSPILSKLHYIPRQDSLQALLTHLQAESLEERHKGSDRLALTPHSDSTCESYEGQEIGTSLETADSLEQRVIHLGVARSRMLRSHVSFIRHKLHSSTARLNERRREVASWTYDRLSETSKATFDAKIGNIGCCIVSEDAQVERLRFLLQLVRDERKSVERMEVAGPKQHRVVAHKKREFMGLDRYRAQAPSKVKALQPWEELDEPPIRVALGL